MTIWDRIRKSTLAVSEKSGEVMEMARLRAAIGRLETEKVKKCTELGELTYRIYNDEDVENGEIEELCRQIRELDRELQDCRRHLTRPVPGCPGCDRPAKAGARYCQACGHELPVPD